MKRQRLLFLAISFISFTGSMFSLYGSEKKPSRSTNPLVEDFVKRTEKRIDGVAHDLAHPIDAAVGYVQEKAQEASTLAGIATNIAAANQAATLTKKSTTPVIPNSNVASSDKITQNPNPNVHSTDHSASLDIPHVDVGGKDATANPLLPSTEEESSSNQDENVNQQEQEDAAR